MLATWLLTQTSTIPIYHAIHPAPKELIVSMAAYMCSADIAHVTHISQHTIQRVIALWKKTWKVEQGARR